jgi:hypothetical protein
MNTYIELVAPSASPQRLDLFHLLGGPSCLSPQQQVSEHSVAWTVCAFLSNNLVALTLSSKVSNVCNNSCHHQEHTAHLSVERMVLHLLSCKSIFCLQSLQPCCASAKRSMQMTVVRDSRGAPLAIWAQTLARRD